MFHARKTSNMFPIIFPLFFTTTVVKVPLFGFDQRFHHTWAAHCVEAVDDAGDTEEGDTDEHDIIDEEDGGDDAGDGDTSIEEENADATPPRANLASTFPSAISRSVPFFAVAMRPIIFPVPLFLLILLRWLRVFISSLIIDSSSIAAAEGILRHQIWSKGIRVQARHA